MDAELQQRLQRSYHEQLERAKAAGRYRRAAYIAAHLLGDFRLAAVTLEQGGHFAEAAVLYRDKLRQSNDAARCFASAGQWEQAVQLYRDQGDLERAGDLLREVGEEAAAVKAYEDAADRLVAAGRVMDASELIDKKLDRREQVMQLLWSQWPRGLDSVTTTTRAFELLSENAEHEEVLRRLRWLGESAGEDRLAAATIYRAVAKSTPDEAVRLEAEDACRVIAVEAIEDASPLEIDQRMELVGALDDPHGLLARDARRFADQLRGRRREQGLEEKTKPSSKRPSLRLELDRTELQVWDRVVFADLLSKSHLRVIGAREGETAILTTSLRDGHQSRLSLEGLHLDAAPALRFHSCDHPPATLLVSGWAPTIKSTSSLPSGILNVNLSPLGPADQVAITSTGQVAGLEIGAGGGLTLGRLVDGEIVHDQSIPMRSKFQDVVDRYGLPGLDLVRLIAVERELLMIGGEMVMRPQRDTAWTHALRAPTSMIDASLPWTRQRFAAIDEEGVVVYWLNGNAPVPEPVAEGEYQRVKLLHGGMLLAVREDAMELYQATRNGYVRCHTIDKRVPESIVAILPRPERFEVVFESGEIEHWRVVR
ncbi:MAG: hypothetical protein AAFU85_22085 [Planctomycetota bacterium]